MAFVEQSVQELDLNEVVVKYRPVVSFKVRKSLGSQTPDWEDVVNEIITQVIEKVKKGEFRGESSIGTFIYTITSRRIVDYIRQKTKILRGVPEPSPWPDPCEDAETRERAKMLAEAIQQLKPKFKEVLQLYYYQEMSRSEVAERLGISPRRVSERINYAQKLLRKMIKT
jgi:RNA polymerase sigma-70 factor (ECF subfamily)